jgi:hypothetical protein
MADLFNTSQLLREVFPADLKYLDETYLDWLYRKSPSGTVIESNRDDEIGRIGHYAVVPQKWSLGGTEQIVGLSLNTAVSERARGMGMFTMLAGETYLMATEQGVGWIVGVANANSTPGFTRKLGFDLKGSLDARAIFGISLRRPTSVDSEDVVKLRDHIEQAMSSRQWDEFKRYWTIEELQWRLANPAARYWLIVVGNCLIVATRSTQMGVPIGVILKIFVGGEKANVSLSRIARYVSRAVKAPLCVYGGVNNRIRTRGIRIPRKFRPSPLNVIVKSLGNQPRPTPTPSVMEFLDFDAY